MHRHAQWEKFCVKRRQDPYETREQSVSPIFKNGVRAAADAQSARIGRDKVDVTLADAAAARKVRFLRRNVTVLKGK